MDSGFLAARRGERDPVSLRIRLIAVLLMGWLVSGCESPPPAQSDHGLTVEDTMAPPDTVSAGLPGPLEVRPPPPEP